MHSDQSDPMNPSLPIQSSHTRARSLTAPFIAILFLTGLFASGCVIHDRGHGRGHYGGPVAVQPQVAVAVPAPITFSFTDNHRHRARNYYHDHPRHHGKKHKWKKKRRGRGRGRGHLPPGLARRDHLPPGIQMQAVPVGLVRQLPPPPRGTQYGYYNDQVLLFNVQTRVVLDFINIQVGF